MGSLSVVGGLYAEKCIQPLWNEVFGSGGRAAAAVSSLVPTTLVAYVDASLRVDADDLAARFGFTLDARAAQHPVSFSYLHPLATPVIRPSPGRIVTHAPLRVRGDVVLRYGMLEGDAVVDAQVAVHDPQSAFGAKPFSENGSKANRLAVVLNRYEAMSMVGTDEPDEVAKRLMRTENAEVVVLKMGGHGAFVAWQGGTATVPVYSTEYVWKIGSGDVFSATFAALWGVQAMDPVQAADLASRATADYCNRRTLPIRQPADLAALPDPPVTPGKGTIYLAGPFFDLAQRWLVEETRAVLLDMGAEVFSPVHAVGPGRAEVVAPADIKGLEASDVVFAILNGMDPGTVFEVGYAVKLGIPVVAFAENVKPEDLKMVVGTGCEVVDDYTSAVYRAMWRLPVP